jgi:hypothetical protein
MFLAHVLIALAFFIIAVDFSSMHGGMAHSLGIPLAGLARGSNLFIPFAAFLPFYLSRRIPAWFRFLGCYVLMLAIAVFPIVVFALGSRGVNFSGEPPPNLTEQLHSELGFPVVVLNGSHVYFPRVRDPALIREALRRHQLQPNP